MKHFWRLFLVLQIVGITAALTAVSLSDFVQAEQAESEEERPWPCAEGINDHIDYYYELLAEKNQPHEVERWQNIKKERDLLLKAINEAQKRELLAESKQEKEWAAQHEKLQKSFLEAVKKRDEEQISQLLTELFAQYELRNKLLKEKVVESE
ncbi:hypothetical protein [Halalkalibacter oceani]|uniref:hypothetical protein n=1 Tax=Halalkalibacter oceani TaxID=1653776 RepID=UPI003390BB69